MCVCAKRDGDTQKEKKREKESKVEIRGLMVERGGQQSLYIDEDRLQSSIVAVLPILTRGKKSFRCCSEFHFTARYILTSMEQRRKNECVCELRSKNFFLFFFG